jgi:hypothetical protein
VLHEAPHARPVRRLDEVRAVKHPVVRYHFGDEDAASPGSAAPREGRSLAASSGKEA